MATATQVYLGTGRRKTAVARVRMTEGSGKVTVNGKDIDGYFPTELLQVSAMTPAIKAELKEKIDIVAKTQGGGLVGQAEAMSLGLARALQKMDSELRPVLKSEGLLTRDQRMRERKKSGQPGARKRFQFSKR
ncbi:MAG: 30S ribosomal protein S9 [Verrucomicrobiota bacterium]